MLGKVGVCAGSWCGCVSGGCYLCCVGGSVLVTVYILCRSSLGASVGFVKVVSGPLLVFLCVVLRVVGVLMCCSSGSGRVP